MRGSLKRRLIAAGVSVSEATIRRLLRRDTAIIFMMHRFEMPDIGVKGHDVAQLRDALAMLRHNGCRILSLSDLLTVLYAGEPLPEGALAFTIDDGYLDQASVAAPVFAEFDCPVTTFVTTGFIDGTVWPWWDRVAHVFESTVERRIEVTLGDESLSYHLSDTRERNAARDGFIARCKGAPSELVSLAIHSLAAAANVPLPAAPPPRYAPMTWDDVRRCEKRGMSFGPHTVTHPILSKSSDIQSAHEITESWCRLRAKAANPVDCFCYPNGNAADFGPREIATIREEGLRAAVVATPGFVRMTNNGSDMTYRLPRFAWTGDTLDLRRLTSGFDLLTALVRGRA